MSLDFLEHLPEFLKHNLADTAKVLLGAFLFGFMAIKWVKSIRRASRAQIEAERQKLVREAETLKAEGQEALKDAKRQAQNALDESQKEAKEIASKARKDAKEKKDQAGAALDLAIRYSLEIRQNAERRAREIAGEAYDAKGKLKDYQAAAQALQNRIEKYEGIYLVPPAHILDELADVLVDAEKRVVGACHSQQTAGAVAAFVDDPRRFPHAKAVGRYFGLVPSQDQSGDRNRHGDITSDGAPVVRQLVSRP